MAFTVLLALYGYAQGFIVGALSLVGIRARSVPRIPPRAARADRRLALGVRAAVRPARGAARRGGAGGRPAGPRCARPDVPPPARVANGRRSIRRDPDRLRWRSGSHGSSGRSRCSRRDPPLLRRDIQRSAILQELNQLLPPSGPFLHALARIDPVPSVRGPEADVPPPPRGIVAARGVRLAEPSVVKVLGTACGLGIEGSGWVAAPGVVVTNAHVVAGEQDTTVQAGGNPPGLDADVIDFDPHDDIAVLRVDGLDEPALRLAGDPQPGTSGRDPRLSARRRVRRGARADRPDGDRQHRGRVRQRTGDAEHHRAARAGSSRQLGRPDGRPHGPGGRDRVRRDHERADRRGRLCRAERTGASTARRSRSRGTTESAPGLAPADPARSRTRPLGLPSGRAVVCTPPAPRCMPPGAP